MPDMKKTAKDRMSVRHSVFVWVGGAVFAWVLLMVSIYNVVRFDEAGNSAGGNVGVADSEAKRLNDILPAAGGDKAVKPEDKKDKDKKDEDETDKPDGMF